MDRTVEYIIKLQDRLSPIMEKVRQNFSTASRAADNLQKTIDKTASGSKVFNKLNSDINRIPRSVYELREKLRDLNAQFENTHSRQSFINLRREIRATESELNSLIGKAGGLKSALGRGSLMGGMGMGRLMGTLGLAGGIYEAVNLVKQGVFSSARISAEFEQIYTDYEVMLGSKVKAAKMIGELIDYANKSPLRSGDVFKATNTLLGFGVAQEKILPAVKMIGDVAKGNKERFEGLSLAYAQTQAAGRLMGQDLLQMINQGFNPLKEISEMTGRSMKDLRKDMENGRISSDMVAKAFQHATAEGGRFFNMADKQSKTLLGTYSTMQDAAQLTGKAIGDRMAPALKNVTLRMSGFLNMVREFVEIPVEEKIRDQITQISILKTRLGDVNLKTEERRRLLEELKDIDPKIVEGLKAESLNMEKLSSNISLVVAGLKEKFFWERANKEYREQTDKLTDRVKEAEGIQNWLATYAYSQGFKGDNWLRNVYDLIDSFKKMGIDASLVKKMLGEYYLLKGQSFSMEGFLKKLKTDQENLAKSLGYAPSGTTPVERGKKSPAGGSPLGTSEVDLKNEIGSIPAGGSKATNITINLGKLQDKTEIHVDSAQKGIERMGDSVTEQLMRILNSANLIATQ